MQDLPNQIADLEQQGNLNRMSFLRTELATGMTLAALAETEYEIGETRAGARSTEHAEEAYRTLRHFLTDPKHLRHITPQQLRELTAGLGSLRAKLDGFPHT